VSGTYNYVDSDDEAVHGTVSGTLTGRVLELLWNEEDESSGTARLKFSQDGLSFDGTWRDAEGDESGEWHGTKQ
jgi:hypothetical protein